MPFQIPARVNEKRAFSEPPKPHPARGSILASVLETNPAAVPAEGEIVDLAKERLAAFVPLFAAAQDERRLAQPGEADFLGTGLLQLGEFVAEGVEENELEAVARLHGGVDEGNGDRRREGAELVGDPLAADFHQHPAHALEEILKVQQLERAFGFQIEGDAAADVLDEGEVPVIGGDGRAADGVVQPGGVIVDHLMAADLQGGAIADEGDHGNEKAGGGGSGRLSL